MTPVALDRSFSAHMLTLPVQVQETSLCSLLSSVCSWLISYLYLPQRGHGEQCSHHSHCRALWDLLTWRCCRFPVPVLSAGCSVSPDLVSHICPGMLVSRALLKPMTMLCWWWPPAQYIWTRGLFFISGHVKFIVGNFCVSSVSKEPHVFQPRHPRSPVAALQSGISAAVECSPPSARCHGTVRQVPYSSEACHPSAEQPGRAQWTASLGGEGGCRAPPLRALRAAACSQPWRTACRWPGTFEGVGPPPWAHKAKDAWCPVPQPWGPYAGGGSVGGSITNIQIRKLLFTPRYFNETRLDSANFGLDCKMYGTLVFDTLKRAWLHEQKPTPVQYLPSVFRITCLPGGCDKEDRAAWPLLTQERGFIASHFCTTLALMKLLSEV